MLNLIFARADVSGPKPRYMVERNLDQDRVTLGSSILRIKQLLKHRYASPHHYYRLTYHLIINLSFYYKQVLSQVFQHSDSILNEFLPHLVTRHKKDSVLWLLFLKALFVLALSRKI